MLYTIDLSQLNTLFGVAMPAIVAFLAGLLRQDRLDTPKWEWINELLFHVVLLGMAFVQTMLGGQWGGSGVSNFVIVASLSYGALSTKYGSNFLQGVQSATSIRKLPPAPPAAPVVPPININVEQLAQVLAPMVAPLFTQHLNLAQLAQLLKSELLASNQSVEDMPTQTNLQIVRAPASVSMPPPQGG